MIDKPDQYDAETAQRRFEAALRGSRSVGRVTKDSVKRKLSTSKKPAKKPAST